MISSNDKKYYAFISYKRDDQKWAEWMQQKLEHYKMPSNLNGRDSLPKEIRPVFRDKSELAAGVLADEIQKALDNSKYLIVICSPHSAKSEWVNKEIQAFIDSGRTDKIIPFIIEGTPNSGNEDTECFPKAIRELPAENELLGVNINEMGRDAAAVKVIAQMFGLRFDDLWQRHEREKRRKKNLTILAGVFAFIVMSGIALWMYMQRQQTLEANWKMLENQSKIVAKDIIADAQTDSYLARMVALEILPKDVNNPVDRPYTPEAEKALRMSYNYNSTILRGHTDAVNSCAFSPDGKLIASTSYGDSTLRIWDAETGREIRQIKHNDGLSSAVFSPDGKQIVSTSYDHTLRIWDTETGAELKVIKDTNTIRDVKFSPNGKSIMFNSYDYEKSHNIKIYDLEGDNIALTLRNYIYANYSPDGRYFVAIPYKEIIGDIMGCYSVEDIIPDSLLTAHDFKLINADTGEELRTFSGQKYLVTSVAFSPDGKRIVSASKDRTIMIWDLETGEAVLTIKDKCPSVAKAFFSPEGKSILSISNYNTAFMLWDADTGEEIRTFNGHTNDVVAAAFSPNGKQIVSASRDKTLRVWDNPTCENSVIINNVKSAAISNNGEFVAYTFKDSTIHVINTAKLSETQNIKNKATRYNDTEILTDILSISCNGKNIIYQIGNPRAIIHGSADGREFNFEYDENNSLIIWDSEVGEIACISTNDSIGWVRSAVFGPNEDKVVITSDDWRVRVFRISDKEVLENILHLCSTPGSAIFSPYEQYITISYLTHDDFYIFDTKTESITKTLSGHSSNVTYTTFNPRGNLIVSASDDKTLRIWDFETGDCIKVLEGHTSEVNHATFSPDGRLIASASNDNTIRVWDAETGACVHIIEGHTDAVIWASFTPDGQHIISYSADGTIRKWDFPPLQELIEKTRERFKDRPLTDKESKMYYLD